MVGNWAAGRKRFSWLRVRQDDVSHGMQTSLHIPLPAIWFFLDPHNHRIVASVGPC